MLNEKRVIAFFMVFILLVSIAPVFVLADDNGDSSNSGSGSSDSSSSTVSDSNSGSSGSTSSTAGSSVTAASEDSSGSGNTGLQERETKINEVKAKEEIKREFRTQDGERVKIERKVEVKNGETNIEITRKITDANGTEREVKIKIERSSDGTEKTIKIEGPNGTIEHQVRTNLNINDNFSNNESDLEVVLSNGNKTRLRILPDQISEIARERLRTQNFTINLNETFDRNISRIVYNVETNKHGRFLGVFKLNVRLNAQIDPQTGQVIDVQKPWWAFLVSGEDNPDSTFSNSTNSTTNANQTNSSA